MSYHGNILETPFGMNFAYTYGYLKVLGLRIYARLRS